MAILNVKSYTHDMELSNGIFFFSIFSAPFSTSESDLSTPISQKASNVKTGKSLPPSQHGELFYVLDSYPKEPKGRGRTPNYDD